MKQKLLLTFLVTSLFTSVNSRAQLISANGNDSTMPKVELGIKAGANMQAISGDLWQKNYEAGFSGGFWAKMCKNNLAVRAEVLISTTKYTCSNTTDSLGNIIPLIVDSVGNKGIFRATYIDIPIIAEYKIANTILIQAGVQYSNLMSLDNLTELKPKYKTIFKAGELSGIIGIEALLPLNLSAGARFRYGFSNTNNEAASNYPGKWTTQGFLIYLSYKIR